MNDWTDEIWKKLDKKLEKVSVRNFGKLPYTTIDGKFNDMAKEDVSWWTNGFWSGLMWLMYEGTKKDIYKRVAQNGEELLDGALDEYEKLHHDVGFMWHLSSGVNYRITGNRKSQLRNFNAANLLAARYNPRGEFIRSWNGDDNKGWVIIDSMMNIPLLYWASDETDDPRYKYIAMSHADKVLNSHIRSDGSVNHIVELDVDTGEFIKSYGGQGYGEGSSWSRGQAWAIYGFALSFIHTREQRYLDAAKRVAHYFISCVSETGYVPRVDFRAPEKPDYTDTTAGAIAACGLIEIARCVPEYEKKTYHNAALKILKALEKYCDWSDDNDSILQMGSEAYNPWRGDKGRHISIIYGDYFFTEAIYKLKGFGLLFW